MNQRNLIIGGAVIVVLLGWVLLGRSHAPKRVVSDAPEAKAKELFDRAEHLKKDGEAVKAKEAYQEIVKQHPDFDNIMAVQQQLESVNMNLIFSNTPVPDKTVVHEVVAGDTLGKVASQYGTTVELIKIKNNLKNDVIRLGQKLLVWTGKFNIFVDKSQNTLILKDGNEIVKIYTVCTGANNSSPVGTFKITSKLIDPVWFNRGAVVPPESPQNVLGSRWMGFDIPGYGIHGTVEPEVMGQQVTAGCVRMVNKDVEELYSMIPVGTEVTIVD